MLQETFLMLDDDLAKNDRGVFTDEGNRNLETMKEDTAKQSHAPLASVTIVNGERDEASNQAAYDSRKIKLKDSLFTGYINMVRNGVIYCSKSLTWGQFENQ